VADQVDRAGFVEEPRDDLRVLGVLLEQDLDGDAPAQRIIDRFVDLAHAASAEEADYFVVTDRATDHRGLCSDSARAYCAVQFSWRSTENRSNGATLTSPCSF
jgi:hypothetical protein